MNTKIRILEHLEGKRTLAVWDLIEEAIKKINKLKLPNSTKEEFLSHQEQIEDKMNRYILIEDWNIDEGFFCHFYEDNIRFDNGEPDFEGMFESYFADTHEAPNTNNGEEILCVDMKDMKCFIIGKKVSYPVKEVKI